MNDTRLDGEDLKELFKSALADLRLNKEEIDELNVFPVPDGDTGTNMTMTLEGGVGATENGSFDSAGGFMKTFSQGTLLGARGNSGVILSQFIKGLSLGMEGKDTIGLKELSDAFRAGTEKAYDSVVNPVEGTILTAMKDGSVHLAGLLEENKDADLIGIFSSLADEVEKSVEHTPELLPVLKEAKVVDSGAAGFLYIIRGMLCSLKGEPVEASAVNEVSAGKSIDFSLFTADSVLEYGYCTEFIMRLLNSKEERSAFNREELIAFLESVGDSIVAVHDDDIVKVHVHTFTPEKVLEYARRFGEFLTVKIENMSLQHNETLTGKTSEPEDLIKKKTAIVAALSGDGLKKYFSEIGADIIIDGGSGSNPSSEDFINAFKKIEAEHIIVLPCNSNVVMAAEQAADIYDGADVRVVEAKTIAEGYAALSMMNLNLDIDSVLSTMEQAIKETETALVAKASRDAEYDDINVTEGHYIGLSRKKVLSDSEDIVEAARGLLKKTWDIENKAVIAGFYGKDISPAELAAVEKMIAEEFPHLEYGFIEGGQKVYELIFAVE